MKLSWLRVSERLACAVIHAMPERSSFSHRPASVVACASRISAASPHVMRGAHCSKLISS